MNNRRELECSGFDIVVDGGLGSDKSSYLDILIHALPSGLKASEAWPEANGTNLDSVIKQPAYQDMQRRRLDKSAMTESEVRCGILDVAGRSIGAAFVGCTAAAFVIAEILRTLLNGTRFEVLNINLKAPDSLPQVSVNQTELAATNPGFIQV